MSLKINFPARIGLVSLFCCAFLAPAKERWTELNIGPFYAVTDSDTGAAREMLTQFEQVRWVLGGLLESQDLPSLWPIRVILTNSPPTGRTLAFSEPRPAGSGNKFVFQNGQYLLVASPKTEPPVGQVAGMLLDANTPRLPSEVESGLRALFSTLKARGSRVTWGGAPAHPDLAWARMQLLATKFEYASSFHIFLAALKSGSTLRVAEQNAFGKDYKTIEQEAAANLASGNWQPVSVSGRPLDPKRDLGLHSLEGDLQSVMQAGGNQAFAYVDQAKGLTPEEARPLLKKAAQLNPLWGEPVFLEAQLSTNPAEKEALLKKAAQLDPRATKYWLQLAHLQTANGHASAAQGSWLRAEDSAPTEAERARIHQARLDSEQERLDAAERERIREREAAHLADEKAQDSEAARIRAAEEKANQSLDSASSGSQPSDVVPWNSLAAKKVRGTLIHINCLRHGARLSIRTSSTVLDLFLADSSKLNLTCGQQSPGRHVSVAYVAQPDDVHQTTGNITTIEIQ
jgi:hypothetical protein